MEIGDGVLWSAMRHLKVLGMHLEVPLSHRAGRGNYYLEGDWFAAGSCSDVTRGVELQWLVSSDIMADAGEACKHRTFDAASWGGLTVVPHAVMPCS